MNNEVKEHESLEFYHVKIIIHTGEK